MASAITLSFVCGKDVSSRLIAWWGSGYGGFSHVDAVLPDGTRLGARNDEVKTPSGTYAAGVQIRPADYGVWIRRRDVSIPVSDFTFRRWLRSAKDRIGAHYDQGAIVDFVIGSKRLHEPGHWICSALQADLLACVGLLKPVPIPFSQVTPDSLFLMVSQI